MKNKKIVIGATGYIGQPLLSKAKIDGVALGTSSKKNDELVHFSLDNPLKFDYSVIDRDDVVFLTAAISAPDICAKEYQRAWELNVKATSDFIDKLISVGARVIFFSSDAVYGECSHDFDESYPGKPHGEYAVMKRAVESLFLGNDLFKSVRLSYVFSKKDKLTNYLINCAQDNKVAELFDPFHRSVIHREDVVDGVIALANYWSDIPEQIINFGGPEVLSRVNFAENLKNNYLHHLTYKVTRPGEDFFSNRPRIISMRSPILSRLLGREPRNLKEAVLYEFKQ